MKHFNIYQPTFKHKLSVFVGDYGEYCKELDIENDGVKVSGELTELDNGVKCLFLKEGVSQFVIAHECLHITVDLCERKGIPVNKENQEVLAYVQEWYFRRIMKEINLLKEKHG